MEVKFLINNFLALITRKKVTKRDIPIKSVKGLRACRQIDFVFLSGFSAKKVPPLLPLLAENTRFFFISNGFFSPGSNVA